MPYQPGVTDISGQIRSEYKMKGLNALLEGFQSGLSTYEQNQAVTRQALGEFKGMAAANPDILALFQGQEPAAQPGQEQVATNGPGGAAMPPSGPKKPSLDPKVLQAFQRAQDGKADVYDASLLSAFGRSYVKAKSEDQAQKLQAAQVTNLLSEAALRKQQIDDMKLANAPIVTPSISQPRPAVNPSQFIPPASSNRSEAALNAIPGFAPSPVQSPSGAVGTFAQSSPVAPVSQAQEADIPAMLAEMNNQKALLLAQKHKQLLETPGMTNAMFAKQAQEYEKTLDANLTRIYEEKIKDARAFRKDALTADSPGPDMRWVNDKNGNHIGKEPIKGSAAEAKLKQEEATLRKTEQDIADSKSKELETQRAHKERIATATSDIDATLGNIDLALNLIRKPTGTISTAGLIFGGTPGGPLDSKLAKYSGGILKPDTYRLMSILDSVKASLRWNKLAELKALSPSGSSGAGSMSNQEGESMERTRTNLDPNLDEEDIVKNLQLLKSQLSAVKHRLVNGIDVPNAPVWDDSKEQRYQELLKKKGQ